MRFFNAFQLVLLFACFPLIISWLRTAHFVGSYPLVWVCMAAYIIEFGFLIAFTADGIKED